MRDPHALKRKRDAYPQASSGLLSLNELKHRISDTLLRYTIPWLATGAYRSAESSSTIPRSRTALSPPMPMLHQEVMRHLRVMLFDARVHDKWSYEQLPMVQRIMNTVEKTSTGVSSAELILNNSIRLSNRILAPGSANPTSRVALSGTMDNWVAHPSPSSTSSPASV